MQTQERQYIAKDFFTYEVDFAALLAVSSATQTFTIQADSDFILSKLAFSANIANAAFEDSTRPVPNVSVMIQDTGSGRNLMNLATPIPNIFGTGQFPFILPRQRIFLANATVNVTLNNYDATEAYNLRLSFIGEKAFLA